jgi:hypothetical protein
LYQCRQWRFEFHFAAVRRVDQCQPVRMEQMVSDPALVGDRISYCGVESISDDGMARECAVNPELMCSARQCFQLD